MTAIFTSPLTPIAHDKAGWDIYAHKVTYGSDYICGMVVIHMPTVTDDSYLLAEVTELMLMTGALPSEGIDPSQMSCKQFVNVDSQLVVVEYHSRPPTLEDDLANYPGAH